MRRGSQAGGLATVVAVLFRGSRLRMLVQVQVQVQVECLLAFSPAPTGFYNSFKDRLRDLAQGCDTTVWLCLEVSGVCGGGRGAAASVV